MKLTRLYRVGQALYGLYLADPLTAHTTAGAAVVIGARSHAVDVCHVQMYLAGWLHRHERAFVPPGSPEMFAYQATTEGERGMRAAVLAGVCTPPGVRPPRSQRGRSQPSP